MKDELEEIVSTEISRFLLSDASYNEMADHFRKFLLGLSKQHDISPVRIIDQVMFFRRQHKNFGDDPVLEFLNAYRISAISRRRKGTSQQIKEASHGKIKLDPITLNEIVLTQNRARGKIYENMGFVLVEYYLRNLRNYSGSIKISADRTTFDCIDSKGKPSKRRYDLFLLDFKIGIEIKSGRISFQDNTKDQICKDHYLLMQKVVSEVWWFLFYGASQKVLTELLARNINFIDLGLNDFEDMSQGSELDIPRWKED